METAMTNSFIKMSGTLGKEANIAFENTRKRDDGFSREDEERDDGLRREDEERDDGLRRENER
jgi:hypothetical protein